MKMTQFLINKLAKFFNVRDFKKSNNIKIIIDFFNYFLLAIIIFVFVDECINILINIIHRYFEYYNLLGLDLINASLTKKFVGGGENINVFIQSLVCDIYDISKNILKPLQVNYSNEVLANQITEISILLFILGVLTSILIAFLLVNMVLYMYMDRIIQIFNNKFIKLYLIYNKKMLAIEIFVLGATILYFMYFLLKGTEFIATHPIVFN